MGASHSDRVVFNVPISALQYLIRENHFSNYLNISMKSENLFTNGVWYRFHHGMSFTSYGEKITITLTSLDAYSTMVDLHSECGLPTQIFDWGKNKSNCDAIIEYIQNNINRFIQPQNYYNAQQYKT